MLDPKEYERLQKRFRMLNDETLLDMLKNKQEDFRSEALELIKTELKLRGYRDEDMVVPESDSESESADLRSEGVTAVAKCPDEMVASQVIDLLSQNGISSTVREGLESTKEIVGIGTLWTDRSITIVVASHDAQRAKEILADFPPLMGETNPCPDSKDEAEK